MRVVFDTNIIISGLLYSSNQRKLLNHVIDHTLELVISHPIIEEVNDVIQRDKFKVQRELSVITIAELIDLCRLVIPLTKLNVVKDDPDDNIILECAIEGKARYIVSGDSDLLRLKEYSGIKILDSRTFLTYIQNNDFH